MGLSRLLHNTLYQSIYLRHLYLPRNNDPSVF